jgi:hypothetical protein
MTYVVHVFPTKQRYKWRDFRAAFRCFKAMRGYRGVAMWHGSAATKWTRVYATEGYPERLSRPWCKG